MTSLNIPRALHHSVLALVLATVARPTSICALEPAEGFSFPAPTSHGENTFTIAKVAGSKEADNIFSMALDGDGHVLVSSRGYIRRLRDTDGDGFLETSELVYRGPGSGCQGMLVVDSTLYYSGGRGVEKIPLPAAGAEPFAGKAELVLPCAAGGEHNAHALRRGADGFLYLLGGNFVKLDLKRVQGGVSPVVSPYAGLLVRLLPDATVVEVIAHGMRNAYDFDFLPDGEILAWDSDGERDEGLPWYRPTRVYHLTPGADCGWRSSGSGKVPTQAFDTAAPVAEAGRGSPTGVVAYRHDAFPPRYRNGIFALDWTFGRALFFPLEAKGGTFTAPTEVFLQASGSTAFAPSDAVVAPNGDLLISSGGRGLEGAVFRVSFHSEEGRKPFNGRSDDSNGSEVGRVLRAPMPLSEWSRRRWLRAARTQTAAAWQRALISTDRPLHERIRALDVLCELHPAAFANAAQSLPADAPDRLTARVAWWAGRLGASNVLRQHLGSEKFTETLTEKPQTLRAALEAIPRIASTLRTDDDQDGQDGRRGALVDSDVLAGAAQHPARRVRQALAWTLAQLPQGAAPLVSAESPHSETTRARIVLALVEILRTPRGEFPGAAARRLTELLEPMRAPREPRNRIEEDVRATGEDLFDTLRLIEIAFENLQPQRHTGAVFYESWNGIDLTPYATQRGALGTPLVALARSGEPATRRQAARLLGLLQIAGDESVPAILSCVTPMTSPGEDLWTLSYLTRRGEPWPDGANRQAASALLGIGVKVAERGQERDGRWHKYVTNLWEPLQEKHPRLRDALLADASFGRADHIVLARSFPSEGVALAVERFLKQPLPLTTGARLEVVRFLTTHRSPAVLGKLRELWEEPDLQATILSALARRPEAEDRGRFVEALSGDERRLIADAVRGLLGLPLPAAAARADEALRLIRWGLILDADASRRATRDLVAKQLRRLIDSDTGYRAESKERAQDAFLKWGEQLVAAQPDRREDLAGILDEVRAGEQRVQAVAKKLETALDLGPARRERGRQIFQRLECHGCHATGAGGDRLGPDLRGLGKRFSPGKTLESIAFPNREVAPRYRAKLFVLKNGEVIHGLPVYDSRAAMLLRTPGNQFRRIAAGDVVRRENDGHSMMPSGLIDALTEAEIIDLIAYLQKLE